MKRFSILTTGRAGSTSLMQALARCNGVGLPDSTIGCDDFELLHPQKKAKYIQYFEQLTQTPLSDPQLVEAFYSSQAHQQFAGFKSMPNRHQDYEQFIQSRNITFITLSRRDIPSTIASFTLAMHRGTWRRYGGSPDQQLVFNPEQCQRIVSNIRYLHKALAQLGAIQNPIRLVYEELCQPDFCCPQLDAFFGQSVQIASPQPPTSGASYVVNWDEFSEFVDQTWSQLESESLACPAP